MIFFIFYLSYPLDLYSSYNDIEYKKYENNYEKINYDTIKKQLNNKINLSYSNINVFYQCQFRFLLNNIYFNFIRFVFCGCRSFNLIF